MRCHESVTEHRADGLLLGTPGKSRRLRAGKGDSSICHSGIARARAPARARREGGGVDELTYLSLSYLCPCPAEAYGFRIRHDPSARHGSFPALTRRKGRREQPRIPTEFVCVSGGRVPQGQGRYASAARTRRGPTSPNGWPTGGPGPAAPNANQALIKRQANGPRGPVGHERNRSAARSEA